MLSQATIKNLQKIIREEYDHNISFEEAEEILDTLVPYYDVLAKVYHKIKTENDEPQSNNI